jgi:hypothetical protein
MRKTKKKKGRIPPFSQTEEDHGVPCRFTDMQTGGRFRSIEKNRFHQIRPYVRYSVSSRRRRGRSAHTFFLEPLTFSFAGDRWSSWCSTSHPVPGSRM